MVLYYYCCTGYTVISVKLWNIGIYEDDATRRFNSSYEQQLCRVHCTEINLRLKVGFKAPAETISYKNLCINISLSMVIMQGKLYSEVYAFFVLQCTVFGRKSEHKTDVTAWHESIFTKMIYEIFWSLETSMWIIKIIKIKCV